MRMINLYNKTIQSFLTVIPFCRVNQCPKFLLNLFRLRLFCIRNNIDIRMFFQKQHNVISGQRGILSHNFTIHKFF